MSAKSLNFKLVLLGDSAVGKSSTVERFVKNEYFDFQQPTIGASFFAQTIKLSDGNTIKFEIWDTAGQDRYRTLAPMYYRGAAAAIVVYDITDHDSFNGAKTYVEELQRQGSADIVIALAGNKVDLEPKREVWASEARAYAQENGCLFFECSAKTGENVSEIFHQLAEKLPKDLPPVTTDYVMLNSSSKPSGGCCK